MTILWTIGTVIGFFCMINWVAMFSYYDIKITFVTMNICVFGIIVFLALTVFCATQALG